MKDKNGKIRWLFILTFSHFLAMGFAQHVPWEYALSEAEYEGSQLNDLLLLDDQVVVAGGIGTCMTPFLWIFDTSGIQTDQFSLVVKPYGYGMITGLQYDSIDEKILAIGNVAGADDVGAQFGIIFRLNLDFSIDTVLDCSTIADHNDHEISFLPNGEFLLREHNLLFIINRDLGVRKKLDFPVEPFQDYGVLFMEDTFYTCLRSGQGRSTDLTQHNTDGKAIKNITVAEYSDVELVNDCIFTLGTDLTIRKYDRHTLILSDSLSFNDIEQMELSVEEGRLQVIQYSDHSPVIEIYDENFTLLHRQESSVAHESRIRFFPLGTYAFRIGLGHFASYPYSNYRASVIPFVRKETLSSKDHLLIDRPLLLFSVLSILNTIIADDCRTDNAGNENCYYGNQPIRFRLTFENQGEDTINNVSYYTSVISTFNCFRKTNYRYREALAIAPGTTATLQDSFFTFTPEGTLDSIVFYLGATNHLLQGESRSITSFDVTTSTFETRDEKFSIYPIPVEDVIYFKQLPVSALSAEIKIYDLNGQLVQLGKLHSDRLIVRGLMAGIYMLRIRTSEGKVMIKKLIKV